MCCENNLEIMDICVFVFFFSFLLPYIKEKLNKNLNYLINNAYE